MPCESQARLGKSFRFFLMSDPSLVLPGNLLRRRDAFLESPRSRHVDKRFGMRREDGDGVGREESEAEEVI